MSVEQETSDVTVPPAEVLRKVAPFSRHVRRRGRAFFKPLRRELLQAPPDEISDLDLKIAKCLEMCAAFTDADFVDRVSARFVAKFGHDRVHGPLLRALVFQRRFDEARERADAQAKSHPDQIAAQVEAIRYRLIAGEPDEALVHALGLLPRLGSDSSAGWVLTLLLRAGLAKEVWVARPDLAHGHSGFGLQRTLSEPDGRLPIFCMSLARDARRMTTTRRFVEGAGALTVVPGIDGATLAPGVVEAAVKGLDAQLSPGEIGCSLSHCAVWEEVAMRCADDEYALVLEDDGHFLYGPGKGLIEVLEHARAARAGLVFLNERACRTAVSQGGPDGMRLYPVQHDFTPDMPRMMPRDPGWGGDGYLLNGAEARKLCQIWSEIGILGALDWQLHLMCFDQVASWQDHKVCRSIYRSLEAMGTWPRINGYVSTLPLTSHSDFGFSSINSLA